MKKSIFLAALMLISTCCFAQKSAIRTAKNLAMQETPDFDGARAAIKPALENEETKNLAETWYVAGLIGNKQNENIWLMGAVKSKCLAAILSDGKNFDGWVCF